MRTEPHVYLVCYDISDAKRLRRVHRILRGYGDAMQLSVFLCQLTELQRAHLVNLLERAVHHDDDQVLFVPLGTAGARTTWRAWSIGRAIVEPERVVRIV